MPKEDIKAEFEQAAFKRNSLCNEGTTSGYKYSFSLIHQHTPAGPSKSPPIITHYSFIWCWCGGNTQSQIFEKGKDIFQYTICRCVARVMCGKIEHLWHSLPTCGVKNYNDSGFQLNSVWFGEESAHVIILKQLMYLKYTLYIFPSTAKWMECGQQQILN